MVYFQVEDTLLYEDNVHFGKENGTVKHSAWFSAIYTLWKNEHSQEFQYLKYLHIHRLKKFDEMIKPYRLSLHTRDVVLL